MNAPSGSMKGSRLVRFGAVVAALAAVAATAPRAVAADVTWGANGNTAWATTTNWAGGSRPGSGDVAVFDGLGSGTTRGLAQSSLGSTYAIQGIVVSGSQRSITIGSSGASALSLRLTGATINSVNDVILRNSGTGSLTIASNVSSTGPMALDLGNAANNVILIDNSGAITISATMTGAGRTLTLSGSGSGALTLSASNTYTGTTQLSSGILRAGNDNAFSSSLLLLNGGTLSSDSATARSFANTVRLGGNVAFGDATGTGALSFGSVDLGATTRTLTTAVSTTFSGAVTNGSLTKVGTATLSLTNSGNTFDALTITAGTVAIRGNTTVTGLAGSGGGLNLSAGTLTVNASADQSFGLAITGAGGLTKDGTAALILSAANSGYSGVTTLSAGTLRGADDAAFGSGTLALNGGTITGTGATARSFPTGAVAIGGNVQFGDAAGTGSLTIAGPVNLGGGNRTLTTTVSTTFSGAVTNGTLTKAGAATLALTNAGSTFGGLTITAGTVAIGANTSVTALTGSAGALDLVVGNTLTVNQATSGTAAMPFTGSGGFTKSGGGSLTLTADSSGYTGTTTISGGSLVANGNLGGSVSVAGGGTLAGSGTVGAVTIDSLATLSPGNSPGLLTTGNMTWAGGGNYNWQLFDATLGAGIGWDLVNGGTLTITADPSGKFNVNLWSLASINPDVSGTAQSFSFTTTGTYTIGTFSSITGATGDWYTINTGSTNGTGGFRGYNPTLGSFTLLSTGTSLDLVYTHTPLTSYTWVAGTGLWSNTSNWSEADTPEGDPAIAFAGSGGLSTNDLLSGTGANLLGTVTSLSFTGSATGSYDVAGNAITLGSGGIANDSSFAHSVSAGITLAAPAALAANGAPLTVSGTIDTAGRTLTVGGAAAMTLGTVTGTGSLVKTDSGTAALTAAVASPNVTIAGGVLALGSGNLLADSSTITVSSGALDVGDFNDTVASFAITGGSLGGSGTLTAAAYALNGGTINANLGTGSGTSSSGSTTLNGTLAGDLTVAGGTVALGGADRIGTASAVTISSGSLGLGAFNDTVGSFAITGGALGGSGTLTAATYSLGGGTVAGNLGGGAATSSSGTTTLAGTLAGDLTLAGGTVILSEADRISAASAVTINSGSLGMSAFNDTVGAFTITGGALGGSGTLTTSTYALQGGTVAANLGSGTIVASSGATTLSGSSAATVVNVTSGTLALGGSNRLLDTGTVTLSGGVLDTTASNFSDTVGSFAISGGAVNGGGTITAGTYAFTGGTVNANLGAGTLNATSGATTLNGTSGATAVNIGGGTLTTGGVNKLSDSGTVTLSAGGLTLGGNDTIAAYVQSGGTLGGTATLTAGTYALTGGTVNANIGGGVVTAASGNTSIAGTVAATTVTISGGTLALASAGRLSTSATVTLSAGGFALGGNETVAAYTQSGGSLVGSGTLTAGSYSISGGTVSAALGAGAVTMSGGSLLGTSGQTISNPITIGTADGVATASFSGYWNFTNGASVATVTGSGVTFGDVTTNGSAPTLSSASASNGYTLASGGTASGGNNVSANAASGPLSVSSTYLGFSTTGTAGVTYLVNTVQFGSRSTATGPQSLVLQSSADNFGSNLATASSPVTGNWAAYNLVPTGTTGSGVVSYRLYGASGTGSGANWRIDDLYVSGTVYTPTVQSGSGTLGIAAAGAVTYSGNVVVNNVATLAAVAGGTATFSGAISGSAGAITKTGAGTVILSGTTTFGGGLTVNQGTLVGTTDSLKGSITNAATVVFNQATNGTYAGVMSGAGGLTKTGNGTVSITSLQEFTGPTTISAGALAFSGGGGLSSSLITVAADGHLDASGLGGGLVLGPAQTLAGTGDVAGLVIVQGGATIAPGSSPGTLNGDAFTFGPGGHFNWQIYDLGGGAGNGWDLLSGTGAMTITATAENPFNVNLWSLSGLPDTSGLLADFDPNFDYAFKIAQFASISGFSADRFAVNTAATNGTGGFANSLNGTFAVARGDTVIGGNANELYIVYAAVPEPSTIALAGIGLAAAAWAARRRRCRQR